VTTQAQLTRFSPVKVNLYLRIVGKRVDGYHELETVMLPVQFGDRLTFEPHDAGIVLACDHPSLPTDDTNLVLKAAKLLAQEHGVRQGAKITLQKRAPLAAGVGGGSSNAATALRGLNELWELDLPTSALGKLAAQLGSDINFFLQDGAAVCRGRGEQVQPIPCRLSAHVLLVNPGFGISTPWAYAAWAQAASRLTVAPPDVSLLARSLAEDDLAGVSAALFNSLEAPSVGKFPVLDLLKRAMRASGATGALMSGSGATVFGLFAEKSAAERCANQMREDFGPSLWTEVTGSAAGLVAR
jgi:4-diphosphocytidyl-2-C-methyl-D-erythritol kinase